MSNPPMAVRNAIPVTMPGKAIGSNNRKEMDSRPKKLLRYTAAAANVPKIRAAAVATLATCNDNVRERQRSARCNATPNHLVVKPGNGKVYVVSSGVKV